jgi:hypothetical protein
VGLVVFVIHVVFCAGMTKVNVNQRPYPLDETALVESRTDGINGASNEIIAGGRERLLPIITPFTLKNDFLFN